MSLKQQTSYPVELLTADARSLHTLIPEPTLFHLEGKQKAPLFISVLLHGNETTGLLALQRLLIKYHDQELPRSLSFYLGNTEAASLGLRRLDYQPDYNRIWPGTELANSNESLVAKEIIETMANKQVFASIDIHNNTGLNPHYACITRLDNRFLQLANMFGRLVVYFTRPKGVQCGAFAEHCPAVTLECGKPGQANGVDHAFDYINSCLHLSGLAEHAVPSQDIDIYHTVAQVKVNQDIHFSFDNQQSELLLDKDLERMNFTEIPAGTQLGRIFNHTQMPVTAINESGELVTHHFFSLVDQRLQLNKNAMPSMLTLDEAVIKQDCLCYLMEKIKL